MQSTILSHSGFSPRPVVRRRSQIKTGEAVPEVHAVHRLVRWALYAFVFSILFEEAPIGVPFEVTQITGGLLVVAALLFQPRVCFRRPPAAFWCFVIYFYIGIVILGFNQAIFDWDIVLKLLKLLQLIFLFWISYNLMLDESAAKGALLSLVASCAVLSLLQLFGLTTTTEKALSRLDRLSAYGLGPGNLAGVLSLGMLALIGFAYGLKRNVRLRFLIWPVAAVIGLTIVETASRGPLLALGAGLLVFTFRKGSVFTKVRNVLVILVGIGFFLLVVSHSEIMTRRFQATWEEGSMTSRERIYPTAWQMFLDKPLVGWGPVENTIELGKRMEMARYERLDTHNQIFYVLTATGILGAIPFFTGIGLCVRAAWRARDGAHGILPLAMTVSLLTAAMSSSGLHWKQYWLILAYALASGCQFAIKSQRVRSQPSLLALHPRAIGNPQLDAPL